MSLNKHSPANLCYENRITLNNPSIQDYVKLSSSWFKYNVKTLKPNYGFWKVFNPMTTPTMSTSRALNIRNEEVDSIVVGGLEKIYFLYIMYFPRTQQ